MNPAYISLIFAIIEELVKLEPSIAAELTAIFSKPNPTPEDWKASRARILGTSFEMLCPDAKLPGIVDTTPAATPPPPPPADAANPDAGGSKTVTDLASAPEVTPPPAASQPEAAPEVAAAAEPPPAGHTDAYYRALSGVSASV